MATRCRASLACAHLPRSRAAAATAPPLALQAPAPQIAARTEHLGRALYLHNRVPQELSLALQLLARRCAVVRRASRAVSAEPPRRPARRPELTTRRTTTAARGRTVPTSCCVQYALREVVELVVELTSKENK